MSFRRGRVLVCGLLLTAAGGMTTWSSLSHQTRGVEATATVLEHLSECSVEYQLVGESHRTDRPMECAEASAFQKALGAEKVILTRNDFVRLRYVPEGGRPHEAKVVESVVLAHDAKVAAQLPVVYDPAHLDDVRAPLTMGHFGIEIGMLVAGLALVLLGLGVGPGVIAGAFAGRPKASFARAEPNEDESDAAMVARLREAVAASAAGQSKGSNAETQPSFAGSSAPAFGKRRSA